MKKTIPLTQLETKKTAFIKEIFGGTGITKRLERMGVRPGKKIEKISAHFWRGPITILVDKAKIAIGYGMAQKIMVEV